MDSFATVEDYYNFLGEEIPTDLEPSERLRLEAVMRRASTKIRDMTRLARVAYLRPSMIPRATSIAEAFRDATCAQTQWFEDLEDASGATAGWDDISMAGVSFGKRSGSTNSGVAVGQQREAPEARSILRAAGVFSTIVRSI